MAADTSALTSTIISAAGALLGTGGLGAVILWWVNSRGQRSDALVQAQKDVYGAFEELVTSQQTRIDQLIKQIETSQTDRAKLWEQMAIEKSHSREQDISLLECERRGAKFEATIASLSSRIQELEKSRKIGPRNNRQYDG